MVKPPKTMQPEAVDLSKAGRKSGRAFQADSFHQYMARKIDLQRSQFGLVLPPPPKSAPDSPSARTNKPSSSSSSSSPCKSPTTVSSGRKRPRPSTSPSPTSSTKNKSVTFAALPLQVNGTSKEHTDDDTHDIRPYSMSTILQNLQKRHGKGCRRVFSRRGKRKSRCRKSSKVLDDDGFQQEGAIEKDENNEHLTMERTTDEEEPLERMMPASIQDQAPVASVSIPMIESPATAVTGNHQVDGDFSVPSSASKLKRERPDLFFLGLVIKVNGYTNPDNETLKRLLQRHGGDFETYETDRVTHIVAEHISTAKADYMKQQRRPRPVVLPAWIMDSVKAGKLLPHGDYVLEEMKDKLNGQIGIKDWFAKGTKSTKATTPAMRGCDAVLDEKINATSCASPPASEGTEWKSKYNRRSPIDVDDSDNDEDHDFLPLAQLTQGDESTKWPDEETQNCGQSDEQTSFHLPSASTTTEAPTNTSTATSEGNKVAVDGYISANPKDDVAGDLELSTEAENKKPTIDISERPHGRSDGKYIDGKIRTVGTDPNFLESFFSNSRLSFIGSYKQRTSIESTVASTSDRGRSNQPLKRFVYHIDMDCFFANVVLRNFPQYRDRPVAISHHGKKHGSSGANEAGEPAAFSDNSTSECATCNYHARKFGIQKGMYLGRARQLCPDLIVLHYDFAGYEEVSELVLAILHRVAAEYDGCVEAVSCDEAYMELCLPLDTTNCGGDLKDLTPSNMAGEIAESIRNDIFETTQCTASIGVAANKFLAKVGTDRVKPNGTFVVNDYSEILRGMRLRDLHGIGYRSEPKLQAEGLATVQDVWHMGSKAESELVRVLGPGLGKKIFGFCHGRDDRQVKAVERKTIGAECNYGVRFDGPYGIDHFMKGLANEVEKRMEGVRCRGLKLTLKVKQRKKDAKPPPKFLGHGSCHNLSKSMDFPGSVPTRDSTILVGVGMTLFRELAVPLIDVRGMGMVVSKLSPDDVLGTSTYSKVASAAGIASFFKSVPKTIVSEERKAEEHDNHVPDLHSEGCAAGGTTEEDGGQIIGDASMKYDAKLETSEHDIENSGSLALPPVSQICMSQVAALPPEIQEEIRDRMVQYQKQATSSKEEDRPMDIDADAAPETAFATDTAAQGPEPQAIAFGYERHHYRQTSLRRMMKLAAAKTGQESVGGMTVEEFQGLPLELQLQIVNDDSSPLGVLSQKARNTAFSRQTAKKRASSQRPRSIAHVSTGEGTKPNCMNTKADLANDTERRIVKELKTLEEKDDLDDRKLATEADLFEDDIIPLRYFLDENSSSNADAIHQVSSFLRTCLVERRLNAVVPLVRSMKRRSDGWSNRDILLNVIGGVDEDHEKMFGFRLDIDWLIRD